MLLTFPAEKLAADGIDAKVINIHTIKPIDEELVVAAAKRMRYSRAQTKTRMSLSMYSSARILRQQPIEYYGEYSDYTRKGGVICSDILLPSHAPPEYADRQTLWNAVEKAERGKNAQLAYSFDIALQNEFSLEENIALARQFLLENFVRKAIL